MIDVTLPIRIESTPNKREHWAVKAKRSKGHRETARWLLGVAGVRPTWGRMRVKLTRIAPRHMDSDNLAAGCKATRDGIADWLGIDDGCDRLTWEYAQRKGDVRQYAVQVQITEAT